MVADFASDLDTSDLAVVTTQLYYGHAPKKPKKKTIHKQAAHKKNNYSVGDSLANNNFVTDNKSEDDDSCNLFVDASSNKIFANRSSNSSLHSTTNLSSKSDAKSSSISNSYEFVTNEKDDRFKSKLNKKEAISALPSSSSINSEDDSDGDHQVAITAYSSDIEIDPIIVMPSSGPVQKNYTNATTNKLSTQSSTTSQKTSDEDDILSNFCPQLKVSHPATPAGEVSQSSTVSTIDCWLASTDPDHEEALNNNNMTVMATALPGAARLFL